MSKSLWQPCVTKPCQYCLGLDETMKRERQTLNYEIFYYPFSSDLQSHCFFVDAVQRKFFSTCVVIFWSELRPVANSRLLSRRFKSALLASPQVWLCVPEHLRLLRYKFMYNNFDKYIERVLTNPLWLHQPQCVYRSTKGSYPHLSKKLCCVTITIKDTLLVLLGALVFFRTTSCMWEKISTLPPMLSLPDVTFL